MYICQFYICGLQKIAFCDIPPANLKPYLRVSKSKVVYNSE